MKKHILPILAIIVLVIALAFNFSYEKQVLEERTTYYDDLLSMSQTWESIADNAVAVYEGDTLVGYAGLDTYNGFGGPMLVGIVTDTEGIITKYEILDNKETQQYLDRIEDEGYFTQFDDKDITTGLTFGVDIEGIAAATLSTRAFANCVSQISESIRVAGLGLPSEASTTPWTVGVAEILMAVICAGAIVLANKPSLRKFRPILLIASVVCIGFWLNRPVSMANISSIFMGYFPVFKSNLLWYIIMAAAILPTIITGKNYYCTYICPFGAATEGINFVAKKAQLPLGVKIPFLRKTRNLLVFIGLLVAFLFHNPSVSSFEPFSVLFSGEGTSIQWLLCVTILISALFYKRFWCNGFCPVGGFLDLIAKFRRKIGYKIKHKGEHMEKPVKKTCPGAAAYEEKQLTKKEKLSEALFKVFYSIIIFSVIVSIFERWAIL